MGVPTARANFPSVPSDCAIVPIFACTRIPAEMKSTAIFAVSDGWNMNSQRLAP